ncbi:hypothetical protein NA57DRAFT_57027 [Rhizodiscina lignyota]|uniref:Uncharacterized protein n=1 Tax=Rhizodiscina lignyota TaxID=1504668 RepID=A0A9P4IEX7_9PEZI|nr:hypothetical protein NA57DRAFT_57027 [Rhizodiscina lignyota]
MYQFPSTLSLFGISIGYPAIVFVLVVSAIALKVHLLRRAATNKSAAVADKSPVVHNTPDNEVHLNLLCAQQVTLHLQSTLGPIQMAPGPFYNLPACSRAAMFHESIELFHKMRIDNGTHAYEVEDAVIDLLDAKYSIGERVWLTNSFHRLSAKQNSIEIKNVQELYDGLVRRHGER